MNVDVKLPNLGENVSSGDISTLLVNVGDRVEAQQDILEIETDKAVVPIPSSAAGVVSKIHVARGQTVAVGAVLISLESEQSVGSAAASAPSAPAAAPAASAGAPSASPAAATAPASPGPASPPAAPSKSTAVPAPASDGQGTATAKAPTPAAAPALSTLKLDDDEDDGPAAPAGPATRRLARELGVDLKFVRGTGPNNRITRDDVVAAVRQRGSAPSSVKQSSLGALATAHGADAMDDWGAVRREPMAKIRKTIAAKMVESATTIPHVTNYDDADITELERIRKSGITDFQGGQVKLTMMPFIMKAVSHALRLHPTMNASIDMEKGEVTYKQYVNIGVAVDSERGLVVPVIRAVDQQNIPQIAQSLSTVVEKVRSSSFAVEDLRGGTFTISNLGAIGGTYSTPIINAPEVAILLVGRSRKMPVVVEDQIQIRLMMPLSLSYDHRLVDGAMAARFLTEVIAFLQNPGRLLLTP